MESVVSSGKTMLGRSGARAGFVIFVMAALLLLPLRAACHLALPGAAHTTDVHQLLHGQTLPDPCCASVSDRALVNSAVPDLSSGGSLPLVVALLLSGLVLRGWTSRPPRPAGAPPPSRPYYARSARILR